MAGIVQDVAWESTLPVFSGPLWDEVPEMPAFSFWEVIGDNFVPGNGVVPAVLPTAAAPGSNGTAMCLQFLLPQQHLAPMGMLMQTYNEVKNFHSLKQICLIVES